VCCGSHERQVPVIAPLMLASPVLVHFSRSSLGRPPHGDERRVTLLVRAITPVELGGYLARSSDPPPGNVVIWRGLSRLTDIELGHEIGAMRNVGN